MINAVTENRNSDAQVLDASQPEFKAAETKLLKLVQRVSYQGLKDQKLRKLPVLQGDDGLIRVKTRLSWGDYDEDFKTPILLPTDDPVIAALVFKEHEDNAHAAVRTLRIKIRERFWIPSSHRLIKKVVNSCRECRRFNATKVTCNTPPLPKDRIKAENPFEVTGIDFAGPLYLKNGSKVWFALFTCAVYRAVQLELVPSLSTKDFQNALRRFVGRRGRPKIIYSDNGTNFVGCHNAFTKINWKKIEESGTFRHIIWRFNPPAAPWWGGWWERLVGVVKQSLRKVLGKSLLNFVELQTILCDVEAVVNSRPLTYISEDPSDPSPLTPSLFLVGDRSSNLPEADLVDRRGLNKRLKYVQRVRDDLKSRFTKEYLSQLISQRGATFSRQLKVGEVVLIGRDNMKRIDWPMGTITAIYPGRDGCVRVVKVKTPAGEFIRPVQRIYPMEVAPETSSQDADALLGDQEEEIPEEQRVLKKTRSGRTIKIPDRLVLYID